MIEFNNFTIILKKNDRPIINGFNFKLEQTDKIAIIGEEGNGKSTLLKSIVNIGEVKEYANVSGVIKTNNLNIGYLEQTISSKWNNTLVSDYLLLDDPNSEIDYSNYNLLNKVYDYFYKFDLDYNTISNQTIGTLSGGEKVKVGLVKILIRDVDVLLLDEPTNDLDISTLEWLESFINSCKLPILFISHDETLLENTANGIIHLEQLNKKTKSAYTIERISYKDYIEKRLNIIAREDEIARKQRSNYKAKMERFNQIYQKVEYEQNTISRADPHGARLLKKKIKSMKSMEKRFEKEKENFLDIPDPEEAINLFFSDIEKIPTNKTILDFHLDKLTIDNKELSKNIELKIYGSEHVVLIGANGCGKTTLIKKIYDELKIRKDINVGYMSQNYEDLLDVNITPIEYLYEKGSKEEITTARKYLGNLKFTREEMTNSIEYLSGGQRAKLLLLSLILKKCNVLILDEPTRNLSPLSNPVIRTMLNNFNGSIISVSHDRKYINEVCNKIYELNKDGLFLINDINN